MKMRLNLARALLHDPALIFLDEPTAGIDPGRARTIRDLIRSLKARGRTIFLTTHNMAEAEEVCDRVGFLAHGQVPVTGSPAALKRSFGEASLEVGIAGPDGAVETRVFAMDGLGASDDFIALLRAGTIVAMHTREASLDDIFIRATAVEEHRG